MKNKHTSILLVDDHPSLRQGVKSILEDNPKYKVLNEASNGKEALEILAKQQFDIIFMDINMDEMDGIECTHEIKKLHPETKVLAFTMHKENEHIKAMMEAGASGYILKKSKPEEFYIAIETILNGENYLSDEVKNEIVKNFVSFGAKEPKSKFDIKVELSEREKDVLELIVKEYNNAEIAKKLFISLRTVDSHRRNLIVKTGAKNTAGLVVYALENALVSH